MDEPGDSFEWLGAWVGRGLDRLYALIKPWWWVWWLIVSIELCLIAWNRLH